MKQFLKTKWQTVRKLSTLLIVMLIMASCNVENDETVAIPDLEGAVGFQQVTPVSKQVPNATMTRITSQEVSPSTFLGRSCAGRLSDLTLVEEVSPVSRTSECYPLSLMTPNFGYMMWNNWEVAAGTTAYFADYYNTGVPGSVFLEDYLEGHLTGLNNVGPPPPIAPGTTIQWVQDDVFQIYYSEGPDANGNTENLGDSQSLNISTESLEFLRDKLVCEILDIYFGQYYGNPAPDGYGKLIGEVDIYTDVALCGGARVVFATVEIGHNVYTAPQFPIIDP